jgi:hypothetical protein
MMLGFPNICNVLYLLGLCPLSHLASESSPFFCSVEHFIQHVYALFRVAFLLFLRGLAQYYVAST